MKSTTLNIKKRLLIVEAPDNFKGTEIINDKSGKNTISVKIFKDSDAFWSFPIGQKEKLKFLFIGSELTEEIAKKFVHSEFHLSGCNCEYCGYDFTVFRDYLTQTNESWEKYSNAEGLGSAIESFISAIEASGHTWRNPYRKPDKDEFDRRAIGNQQKVWEMIVSQFNEAESKTFYPDRTLIFEICR